MASRTEMTDKKMTFQVWDDKSILDTLQHEAMELKDKIENARKRDDYGTYKNLILAFKEIIRLVHEEEENTKWVEKSSHYYDEDKAVKGENEYVSTWEQNIKGDIRNRRIFKVEKEIKNPEYTLLKSDTVKINCSKNEEYSFMNFSLPSHIVNLSKEKEDNIKVMTYLDDNKYEENEIIYWTGAYGQIENGFLNMSAINKVKNKETGLIYNKDISIRYEILLKNDNE